MSTASVRSPASSRKYSFARKILAMLKVFIVRWQHYRASRALAGLSDYMLKDMGVSRGEIDPLVGDTTVYRVDRCDDDHGPDALKPTPPRRSSGVDIVSPFPVSASAAGRWIMTTIDGPLPARAMRFGIFGR